MHIYRRIKYQHIIHSTKKYLRLSVMIMTMCTLCLSWGQREAHADEGDRLPDIGAEYSVKVKIKNKKFKFKGEFEWYILRGKRTPTLTGDLEIKDAGGQCGRMRMDYYGEGHIKLVTKHGTEYCAKGNKRQDRGYYLGHYDSNKIDEVRVSLEKKTAKKGWTIIGSKTLKLRPIHDQVKITADGFDFGGPSFAMGAPTKPGDLSWSWKNGKTTPRLTGTIHIKKSAGVCARLQLKYFSVERDLLATKVGGKVCASDNSRWHRHVDLAKYSDSKIASLRINLQTLRADNSWRTVGHVHNVIIRHGGYEGNGSGGSARLMGGCWCW